MDLTIVYVIYFIVEFGVVRGRLCEEDREIVKDLVWLDENYFEDL